jgi:acyl carrier protein
MTENEQDVTEAIRALWAAELQTGEVGDDDDVFDLGATSLQAMRVVSAIETRYGVQVALPEFFTDPTVAGLTRVVRGVRASS